MKWKWNRIQFWIQEKLFCTKQEVQALFLICTLIAAAQVIRHIRANQIVFDDAYYAEADSLFQLLSAKADSLDAIDTLFTGKPFVYSERPTLADRYKEVGLIIIQDTLEKPNVVFPLNINTASLNDLQALPRIGPSLAMRIVEFRKHQLFESKLDLLEVKGIGEKTLEGFLDLIVTEDSAGVSRQDSLYSDSRLPR